MERATQYDKLAVCNEIESEIVRILHYRFNWQLIEAAEVLRAYFAQALRVEIDHTVKGCRDPNDDIFLECAQRANADLIIAGDKDLLVLGTFAGAKIVTPAEYLQLPR